MSLLAHAVRYVIAAHLPSGISLPHTRYPGISLLRIRRPACHCRTLAVPRHITRTPHTFIRYVTAVHSPSGMLLLHTCRPAYHCRTPVIRRIHCRSFVVRLLGRGLLQVCGYEPVQVAIHNALYVADLVVGAMVLDQGIRLEHIRAYLLPHSIFLSSPLTSESSSWRSCSRRRRVLPSTSLYRSHGSVSANARTGTARLCRWADASCAQPSRYG